MQTPEDLHRWTDWHLNVDNPQNSVVFPGPEQVSGVAAAHAERLVQKLLEMREASKSARAYLVEFDGFRYRVQRINDRLYAARTLREVPLKLTDLGLSRSHVELLLSEELKGGLVIVFGNTGAGKTTTVAGTLISRMERLGGYCLCVEDPPENLLEGFHGKGYIEQMDASAVGYQKALVDALRCFPAGRPSTLMLGEIRSRDEAYELAQIGLDGHLVFTTMHAKDIVSGLTRLVSLVNASGEQDVRPMLSASLVMAIHLELVMGRPKMTTLRFDQTASAIVKNGELHRLQDTILLQNRLTR